MPQVLEQECVQTRVCDQSQPPKILERAELASKSEQLTLVETPEPVDQPDSFGLSPQEHLHSDADRAEEGQLGQDSTHVSERTHIDEQLQPEKLQRPTQNNAVQHENEAEKTMNVAQNQIISKSIQEDTEQQTPQEAADVAQSREQVHSDLGKSKQEQKVEVSSVQADTDGLPTDAQTIRQDPDATPLDRELGQNHEEAEDSMGTSALAESLTTEVVPEALFQEKSFKRKTFH